MLPVVALELFALLLFPVVALADVLPTLLWLSLLLKLPVAVELPPVALEST